MLFIEDMGEQKGCTEVQLWTLTPKRQSLIFGPFLKFGHAIVDKIFIPKFSTFWWTCGLVLASRRTNSYKILMFGLGVLPQKQNPSEVLAARVAK